LTINPERVFTALFLSSFCYHLLGNERARVLMITVLLPWVLFLLWFAA
jgi:hypothetical protein